MSELLDTIPAETTQTDGADGSIFLLVNYYLNRSY